VAVAPSARTGMLLREIHAAHSMASPTCAGRPTDLAGETPTVPRARGLTVRYPREYGIWQGMLERCRNPRVKSWASYGGRGIKVCTRWKRSFKAFLDDVGPRPSPRHTLDRRDNDANYEPGNVRWATASEQASNRLRRMACGHRSPGQRCTVCREIAALKASLARLEVRTARIRGRLDALEAVDGARP
jgi:hypothetical protein